MLTSIVAMCNRAYYRGERVTGQKVCYMEVGIGMCDPGGIPWDFLVVQ